MTDEVFHDPSKPPNIGYQLGHYARLFKGVIPQNVLDEILTNIKNQEQSWEQHVFYNTKTAELVAKSGNKELDMSFDYFNQDMMNITGSVLGEYMKQLNFEWFQGWGGFTPPRWNMYKETRKMALHADRIKSMFDGTVKGDPTLSVLSSLNNDYEGGEFVLFENEVVPLEAGDMLVFPSTFMYPHKVEPVTSGVRYSCISWVW